MAKNSKKKLRPFEYVSPSITSSVEQFKSLNLTVIEDEDIPEGEVHFIDKKQPRSE